MILSVFLFVFSIGCAAEEQAEPIISIEAAAPDENGYFDVTVSMENLHFIVFQLAVKYDPEKVVPVKYGSLETAEKFEDFSSRNNIDGISYIGQKLDSEKGYFMFAGFASPGATGEMFRDKMAYITGKTTMHTFRFKRISDGDPGFDIASIYNGDVYDSLFPDGAVVISSLENRYTVPVTVRYAETEKKSETVYYSYSELYPENFTKEQRLAGTVYVVNGDYAAAVDGVLSVIDKNNKEVVPYIKEDVQYFPLRFVCESLGLGVEWSEETQTVAVTGKDGRSCVINVPDGKIMCGGKVTDGKAEIINSRTMVSAEIICEATGARIYDAGGGAFVVYSGIPEWTPDRQAEKDAIQAMQYVLLPFFRMFV